MGNVARRLGDLRRYSAAAMPFVTQIQCRRTKSVFETFVHFGNRYYLLDGGLHFPLRDTHTWCSSCSKFTERENLYSAHEIQTKIDEISASEPDWSEIDERNRQKYRMTSRELPRSYTQSNVHKLWVAGKKWRLDRYASDRCLNCGADNGLLDPQESSSIRHPGNSDIMLLITSCHASVGNYPAIELFDTEGHRIQTPIAG